MALAYQIVLILHILSAAAAFGIGLSFARRAREVTTHTGQAARASATGLLRDVGLANHSALVTVVTGLVLAILRPGGFGALPVRFHIAILLAIVWLVLGLTLVKRSLTAVSDAMGAERAEDAQAAAKKVAMGSGMQHLLFLVLVVLMAWRL